jgi:4-hydroxybenzoate polyprenyltransferase
VSGVQFPLWPPFFTAEILNSIRMQFLKKIIDYCILLRLNKPIGIFLLLWPTLIALWIAGEGHPNPTIVFIFALAVVLMRSAGCVINDMADQKFDAKVSRTCNRPLVTGKVSKKEALLLFILLIALAFLLVLQLNFFTIQLSLLSLLLAMFYPFMKRVTHLPQVILGMAFSMAIPMAFAAQLNTIPTIAWALTLANVCWVVAYDTQYAMVDKLDDLKIGVKSTAILFAAADRWIILILQFMAMLLFILIGYSLQLNFYYYLGLLIAVTQILYQFKLIYKREPDHCLQAFLNNNLLGASIFIGLLLAYTTL